MPISQTVFHSIGVLAVNTACLFILPTVKKGYVWNSERDGHINKPYEIDPLLETMQA